MAAKKKLKKIFAVSKICFIFAVPIRNNDAGAQEGGMFKDDGNKSLKDFTLNRRQLGIISNFFLKTFCHIENSLYFCTRKSDEAAERSLDSGRTEFIERKDTTTK